MTNDATPTPNDAAVEAAQHVVDEVTSDEYSGERTTIEAQPRQGFADAQVSVPDAEVKRLLDAIDVLQDDEAASAPHCA